MEYEEDDEAAEEQQVVELSEAQAQLPNLPLPVSSDGNVCSNCYTITECSRLPLWSPVLDSSSTQLHQA